MSIFTGAGVAIVTPMHDDGSVNYAALGELIEMQIAGGTDAIIICGTTGEKSTMPKGGMMRLKRPRYGSEMEASTERMSSTHLDAP